jgi:predicted permease
MSGGGNTINFSVVGRATSTRDTYSANYRVASPGYFRAMKIPLLQGRSFVDQDNTDHPPVALINETMARRLFPGGDAIGAQLNVDDNNTGPRPVEIAGIVGNVKQLGLESDPAFDIYIPMAQIHEDNVGAITNSQYWVVRSTADSRSLEKAFLGELQRIDRDAATSNIKTLEEYLSESVAPRRFSLQILTIFSAAALLLAVTGIYGVVSYTVTQRTPEIGIRLALGAGRSQVFRLILGQGIKVVLLGIGLGLVGSLATTRVTRTLLFGVTPSDPLTFLFISAMLIVIALAACCIPAQRATRIDPLIALRNE